MSSHQDDRWISEFGEPLRAAERLLNALTAQAPDLPAATIDALHQAFDEINHRTAQLVRQMTATDAQWARYRALFDGSPDGALMTNSDGVIQDVNEAAVAFFGQPKATLLGSTLTSLVAPEDRDLFDAHLRLVLRLPSGTRRRWETRVREASGGLATVSWAAVTDPGEGGGSVRWQIHDVTDRVAAEAGLLEWRRKYQALAEISSDLACEISMTDDGPMIVWANPGFRRTLGQTFVGRPDSLSLRDIVDPDDLAAAIASVKRALDGESVATRLTMRTQTRKAIIVEASFRSSFGSSDPANTCLMAARDITQQVESTARIAASEQRFRGIAEQASDLVYRVEMLPEIRIDYMSPSYERVTGYTAEEIRSMEDPFQVVHPDDLELVMSLFTRPDSVEIPVTFRVFRKDGSEIVLELFQTIERDEHGRPAAAFGIGRDVTERAKREQKLGETIAIQRDALERLERNDRLRSEFERSLSHDMRGPLTTILGLSETAEMSVPPNDPIAEYMQRIRMKAVHLTQIVSNLLDVDRLTQGSVQPVRELTNIEGLLRRAATNVDSPANPILLLAPPDLVASVDAGLLSRVVDNLLGNAIRHGAHGKPVTLRAARKGDEIVIRVEDVGPGVSPHVRHRIFDPNQPPEPPASGGGLGLGLRVVRSFVELMGGRVWVDDRVGGGASFAVAIPDDLKHTGK